MFAVLHSYMKCVRMCVCVHVCVCSYCVTFLVKLDVHIYSPNLKYDKN